MCETKRVLDHVCAVPDPIFMTAFPPFGAGCASTSGSEAAPSQPAISKGAGPLYHRACLETRSFAAIVLVTVSLLFAVLGPTGFTVLALPRLGHGSGDESLYRDLLRKAGGNQELAGKWLEQIASTAPAADSNGGNTTWKTCFSEKSVGPWSQNLTFSL